MLNKEKPSMQSKSRQLRGNIKSLKTNLDKLECDLKKKQSWLRRWVDLSEPFLDFERIILFLDYDTIQLIKKVFEEISFKSVSFLIASNSGQSFSIKNGHIRRLIYISQLVLYVIDNEEKAALKEDEEICQFAESLGAIAY